MSRAALNLKRFTGVQLPFSVCGYEVIPASLTKRNVYSTGNSMMMDIIILLK